MDAYPGCGKNAGFIPFADWGGCFYPAEWSANGRDKPGDFEIFAKFQNHVIKLHSVWMVP
jgi:hypothetical protein